MPMALEDRLALVTGASRGIGRAVALALAKAGAHVVALARTQGALEELDDEIRKGGGEATLVPCDIKDFDAVDRLGAAIHERWGRLDILVGNAGQLGQLTPLAHADPKPWDDVMAVNVTANYRLIRSLDGLLRQSDAGRVLFVSSGVAHRAEYRPYWGPYAISKAALEALARTYAAETATTSAVKVMVANPGPLRTNMRAKAMPGEDPETLKTPDEFAAKLVELCSPDWTETGRLYDHPTGKVLTFRGPAEETADAGREGQETAPPVDAVTVSSADAPSGQLSNDAAPPETGIPAETAGNQAPDQTREDDSEKRSTDRAGPPTEPR